MPIQYVKGNATDPQGDGNKLVIHIVNDIGKFGAGFAKAVMNKYPIVREKYIDWFNGKIRFALGKNQFVKVKEDLWFCNMIAQHGVIGKNNPVPIKYDALRTCIKEVRFFCKSMNPMDNTKILRGKWSVFAPRIGSGLAGGKWEIIEQIINEELIDNGIEVIIYDL